ncbi:uncharacterized protein LOC144440295 [Glandiceps talaboti]
MTLSNRMRNELTVLMFALIVAGAVVDVHCQLQRGIVDLSTEQIQDISNMLALIERLEKNPALLSTHQMPIVSLTSRQQRKISKKRIDFFSSEEEMPGFQPHSLTLSSSSTTSKPNISTESISLTTTSPTETYQNETKQNFTTLYRSPNQTSDSDEPPNITHARALLKEGASDKYIPNEEKERHGHKIQGKRQRLRRSSDNVIRVCGAQSRSEFINLAFNTDGNLVQVVQLPDRNQKQWIYQEECIDTTCDGVTGCFCKEEITNVKALVINLRTAVIATEWISAHKQCVAKRNI